MSYGRATGSLVGVDQSAPVDCPRSMQPMHARHMSRFLLSAALLLLVGIWAGCGNRSVTEHTTTVIQTVSRSSSRPPVHAVRPRRRIDFERYQAVLYAARVPAGWTIEADQTSHPGYVESKWRDPQDANV